MTVLALLAVTAIASREPLSGVGQVAPPGGGRSQINVPPWALVLVAAAALVALLGIVISIRWQIPRRHKREEEPPRRVIQIPLAAKLVALLVPLLLGAVLVVAAIEGSDVRSTLPVGSAHTTPRLRNTVTSPPSGRSTSYTPPTWILPAVVGVVVGAGGAALLVVALRSRLGKGAEPASEAAAALGEAVEASLDDLRSGHDPRRAIIGAYRRLEATLTEAGLPRRAWEAPREYSRRAHNYLELSARPLGTLTALFEQARFGVGFVGEPLREQAIAALVALREELSELTTNGRAAV